MTDEREHFHTAARGVTGVWPTAPRRWSYSSLKEAEECPRRWMLSRATYPGLWEGTGYPPRPILPALAGSVIHHAIEVILHSIHARGCASPADPCAAEAMRAVGGYSHLVKQAITGELEPLQRNPRAAGRIEGLRVALLTRVPDIRQRVQAMVSRTRLEASRGRERETAGGSRRSPLPEGSHPEVELRVEGLRFVGRADTITVHDQACVITDYKTGAPDESHVDQVRLYALLWSRDHELNPGKLPVERLVLSYATHDETIDPPAEADLGMLAEGLAERVAHAEGELGVRPPPAYPALDMCRICSVRHLCEDYWESPTENTLPDASTMTGEFVDCEGDIASQNGRRSWVLVLDAALGRALVRTETENPGFSVGERVRLLGVAFGREKDSSEITLTMTQFSEVFVLKDHG